MTTQLESLQEYIDFHSVTAPPVIAAAAELRRQHERIDALEAENARLKADLLPLQIFMDSVFGEFPEHGDVDGFTLQDIAESCGLLVPEKRSEACSENCTCVTYVDSAGFTKDWTCYRVQPVMKRARIAAARYREPERIVLVGKETT